MVDFRPMNMSIYCRRILNHKNSNRHQCRCHALHSFSQQLSKFHHVAHRSHCNFDHSTPSRIYIPMKSPHIRGYPCHICWCMDRLEPLLPTKRRKSHVPCLLGLRIEGSSIQIPYSDVAAVWRTTTTYYSIRSSSSLMRVMQFVCFVTVCSFAKSLFSVNTFAPKPLPPRTLRKRTCETSEQSFR